MIDSRIACMHEHDFANGMSVIYAWLAHRFWVLCCSDAALLARPNATERSLQRIYFLRPKRISILATNLNTQYVQISKLRLIFYWIYH